MLLVVTSLFLLIVFVFIGPLYLLEHRQTIGDRIAGWTVENDKSSGQSGKQFMFLDKVTRVVSKSYLERKAETLKDIGVDLSPVEFIAIQAMVVLVIIALSVLFHRMVGVIVAAAVPFAVNVAVDIKHRQRQSLLDSQLIEALSVMVGSVKAGYGLIQAVSMAAEESVDPLKSLLLCFTADVSIGMPIGDALAKMAANGKSRDLELMTIAIAVNRQVGGSIADILELIQKTVKDRLSLKKSILTLTAQARMSGVIVGLLPVAISVVIGLIDPGYIGLLFSSPLGLVMVSMAIGSLVAGMLIIRKIIRVKV